MKRYLFLVLLSGIFLSNSAQESLQIKKGRINTVRGELIKFNNLKEGENEFSFNKAGQMNDFTIKIDDVLKIDEKVGDHAIQFGLIMGTSGLLGGIIGYKISEANLQSGYAIDKKASKRNIIVITGISALAGFIWGANLPKYATVFNNSKYSSLFLQNVKLTLALGEFQQIGILYKF